MSTVRGSMTAGDRLPIVMRGRPVATIVVADEADEPTRKAADLLRHYIRLASGAELPVAPSSAIRDEPSATLYVGRHPRFDIAGPADELDTVDSSGFLHWPDGSALTLVGRSGHGTEHAVVEFLERHVGIRWLAPGPTGEHVPTVNDLVIPLEYQRHEPWARSRMLFSMMTPTALAGPAGYDWGRRNRLHGTIEFGHALWRILPPSTYAERHPEWYPPRIVAPRYGWQPRFTSQETVAAAADRIIAHFDSHPEADSVSVAVNDYSGFCDDDLAMSRRRNSAGFHDLSDVYYGWVNAVVDRVLDVHPGKRFGALAYHDVLDPPSFDVHPAVVPFITGDRIAWSDPETEDHGRRRTEAWARRATELGWWEYLHGAQYAVPKVFFDQYQRNLRFAADHRVRHHFGESRPDWGAGPQAWIAARLQWNCDLDVGELLEQWCRLCVGPDSADAVAEYYRSWEAWWRDEIPASDWFGRWKDAPVRSDYLRFDDPSYLDVVTTDTWTDSRRLLDLATRRTRTTGQRTRARLLRRKLDYYDATAQSHATNVVPEPEPTSTTAALALLDRMVQRFRQGARPLDIHREITPPDVLERTGHLPTALDRAGLQPTLGAGAEAAILTWLRAQPDHDNAVRHRLRTLCEEADDGPLAWRLRLVLRAAGGGRDPDGGFLPADGWTVDATPTGSIRPEPSAPGAGSNGFLARGVSTGQLSHRCRLPAGTYGVLVEYTSPGHTRTGHLQIVAEAGADGVGSSSRSPCFRTWRSAGRRSSASAVFTVGTVNTADRPLHDVTVRLVFTTPIEGPSFPCMHPDESIRIHAIALHAVDANSLPE